MPDFDLLPLPPLDDLDAAARRDAIAIEVMERFRAASALELSVAAHVAHNWWCLEALTGLEVGALSAQRRAVAEGGADARDLSFLDKLCRFGRRVHKDLERAERRLAALVAQRERCSHLDEALRGQSEDEAGGTIADAAPGDATAADAALGGAAPRDAGGEDGPAWVRAWARPDAQAAADAEAPSTLSTAAPSNLATPTNLWPPADGFGLGLNASAGIGARLAGDPGPAEPLIVAA